MEKSSLRETSMSINPKQARAALARCLIAGVALAMSPLLVASDKQNTGDGYLRLLSPLLSEVLPFMYSLEEHGLIEPGADGRTEGTVTVPFFKQSLVDASLDELKTQAIRKKLFELSGGLIGEGPSAQPE